MTRLLRGDIARSVATCRPSERPGPHHIGDVRELLVKRWDLLIAFPPCDHLSKVGARWWPARRGTGKQGKAVRFFMTLADARVPRVAIENPIGYMSTAWRKPDQIIQPYEFGEPWRKATCLWLRGLPHLRPTKRVEPLGSWVDGGTPPRSTHSPNVPVPIFGHRNPRERARTFAGIAKAMAAQWG